MSKRLCALFLAVLMAFMVLPVYATQTNDVDYHTMFEKRNQMDDGQIEGYYYELSALFDADPDAFLDALAQEDEQTARELAFPLAIEHQSADSGADYQNALNSSDKKQTAAILKHGVLIHTATTEGIGTKVFGVRCYQELQMAYYEDHRLFLLSVSEYAMSDSYLAAVSDCMTHKLSEDGLIALDKQLTDDAKTEWANEDVKAVISTIRAQIEERLASPQTGDVNFEAVGVFLTASMSLLLTLMFRRRLLT